MSIKATSLKAMALLAAAMLSTPWMAAVLADIGPSLPVPDSVTAVAPALGRYARKTLDDRLWKRPGLSMRDRSIVTLAALIARGQTTDLPFYMRLALDSGVKPSELSGIITHLAFYAGWENAMAAAAAAQPVFAERGIGPDQLAAADLQPLALDPRAEAERAASVDKALGDAAPALVQDTTDVLFRDLWLRPDLSPRDRSLVTVVRAMPMPDAPAPVHVGVDDWAMRKGCSYGTIVVDLDRHRVVDLLPDRTAATLAGWLMQRPGIRVVARDRSTEYARGASLGAPRAVQVADRWHLLANMRQAVERWLHGVRAGLRRLPPIPGPTLPAPGRDRAFPRTASEREAGAESRERWKAAYDEVRRRHAGRETLLGIARAMGLARATVRKYAAADTFPARLPHGPGPSLLDPHVDDLLGRIGEGCENAMALWREIRERGYPGTSRQVHRFVAERRTKPTRSGRKARGETMPVPETPAAEPSLPSARQLAWLLVQAISALDAAAAAVVARVEQDATASAVAALARRFTALVRASGVGRAAAPGRDAAAEFDAWITTAKACSAPEIATFAAGLDGDAAAVRAALTEPWSSGQAEGQINRLKLIKRQSYGRAGLDLLQRRMVLAA